MNGPETELTSTITTAAHILSAMEDIGIRKGIRPKGIQISR